MRIKLPKIGYYLKLAFTGLWKNAVMTFSSVFVLLSCLVIMGTFFAVIENINYNVEQIAGFNKIVLFIDNSADDYAIGKIGQALSGIKGIEKVEFEDKDDALEQQISQMNDVDDEIWDYYRENNPLKNSYVITYDTDANVETVKMMIETHEDIKPYCAKLNVDLDVVSQVNSIKKVISFIFSWLMILLFIVSLFVIINTIKLSVYSRKDEIALMRYIGATNTFISTPFLIEGLVIGAISAGAAFGIQYLIYKYLMLDLINEQYKMISILPFGDIKNIIIIGFVAIGVATGFIGSLISLKKYNREHYN